jgi:acetyl esterase/lipase
VTPARLATAVLVVLAFALAPASASAAVKVRKNVVYGEGRVAKPEAGDLRLRLDIYQPARRARAPRPVVVLIHGGGFVGGRKTDGGIVRTARGLAARGVVVASIDYRLMGQEPVASRRVRRLADAAPKVPIFNAMVVAVDDTLTATDYLRANARKLHIDIDRMGIAGSSAGGITADHVAYVLDDYGIKRPRFRFVGSLWAGIFLPPPPGRGSDRGAVMLERGEAPLFAHHGDADPTVPVELNDELVARAKDVRVRNEYHRIPGAGHGYGGAKFFTEEVAGDQTSFDRFLLFAQRALR